MLCLKTSKFPTLGCIVGVVLVLAVVTLAHRPAQGATASAPVTVVNTATSPVPVKMQGTATIDGSINANITNAPSVNAVQSGSWNVGLNSPVTMVPTAPTQPFSAMTEFDVSKPLSLTMTVAPPATQIAITSLTFVNATVQDTEVFFRPLDDDC